MDGRIELRPYGDLSRGNSRKLKATCVRSKFKRFKPVCNKIGRAACATAEKGMRILQQLKIKSYQHHAIKLFVSIAPCSAEGKAH
jgi:hypothetical protein